MESGNPVDCGRHAERPRRTHCTAPRGPGARSETGHDDARLYARAGRCGRHVRRHRGHRRASAGHRVRHRQRRHPDRGLWTAIIAGFLISALGGSRVQIGGPTGAFVVIVYGIVQRRGIDGLLVATFLGGVFLVVLGVARLGAIIKFVPQPVITGFTSGIAVVILSTQVKDFLGLRMGAVPVGFLEKWTAYAAGIQSASTVTALVSLLTLGILVGWARVPL